MRRDNRVNRTQVQLPDEGQLASVLFGAGIRFARRHYLITATYVLGVLLMLFASGFAVDSATERNYQNILSTIDLKRLSAAEHNVALARNRYRNSKGWFSCDDVCTMNYARLQEQERVLANLEKDYIEINSQARQSVGVFSEYGVSEIRELFWDQFAGGKDFAKRSSWWDLLFLGISSMGRDESILEFAIRFLANMVINFTVGLTGALIGFYWYLWGIIVSYQPSFLIGWLMFFLASAAATSLVVSYLIGLYSAAAGTVYVAVKLASNAARVGDEQRRRQHIRYQQGNRPHFE